MPDILPRIPPRLDQSVQNTSGDGRRNRGASQGVSQTDEHWKLVLFVGYVCGNLGDIQEGKYCPSESSQNRRRQEKFSEPTHVTSPGHAGYDAQAFGQRDELVLG